MIIRIFLKVIIGLLTFIGAITLTLAAQMHFGKLKANVTFSKGKKKYDHLIGRTVSIKI